MGIKGLTALLSEHAPKAITVCLNIDLSSTRYKCVGVAFTVHSFSGRSLTSLYCLLCGCSTMLLSESLTAQEHEMKTLFGRKVAVDASMSIYQFLIAVRQKDGEMLTNDAGETTRCVCNMLKLTRLYTP